MYWKECMYLHLMSVEKMIWVTIKDDNAVLKSTGDDILVKKALKDWIDDGT